MNEAAVAAATILALGTVLVALVTVALHGRGTKLEDNQNRGQKNDQSHLNETE